MIKILGKELNSFFNSLTAYIVITVFLVMMGLILWIFPETNVLDYGYADMSSFFLFGPYVLIFLVPAITMRMFSEEKKSGTYELLITKPVTDWQIIFGKFLAGWILVIISVLPTLIYYYSISALGNPPGNIDTPGVIGSYIGFIFLGGVFTSIGLFASSVTQSQVVAFILAIFFCFLFYEGLGSISRINILTQSSIFIEQIGIKFHYDSISKGLIDSRDLTYFLGVIFLFLSFNKVSLASRTW